MLTTAQRDQIVKIFATYDEFYGSPIIYDSAMGQIVLFEGYQVANNYDRVIIISEDRNFKVTNSAGFGYGGTHQPAAQEKPGYLQSAVNDATSFLNLHNTTKELIGTGLSCGMVAVSFAGLAGSVAGELPSMGAATPLVAVSWVGLMASSAQCSIGIGRTLTTLRGEAGRQDLAALDADPVYKIATFMVDAIGLSTSLIGPGASIISLLQKRSLLPAAEVLNTANRASRQKYFMDAVTRALEDPSLRPQLIAELERAFPGKNIEKMLAQAGTAASKAGINPALKAIDKVVMDRVLGEVRKAIIGDMKSWTNPSGFQNSVTAGFLISGSPDAFTGSASGAAYTTITGDAPAIFVNFVEYIQE